MLMPRFPGPGWKLLGFGPFAGPCRADAGTTTRGEGLAKQVPAMGTAV